MKERLIRLHEVQQQSGKSRASIYADPTFPRSLKIGTRSAAWREADVQRWIKSRIAAGAARADAQPAKGKP